MKYTIKKGKHYSNFTLPKIYFNDTLKFKCNFNSNCLYEFINSDSGDINKLIGISDNFSHMQDSIRIGWKCNSITFPNKIELHAYAHVDGKIVSSYLCSVEPEIEFNGQIMIYENVYMIDILYKNIAYSKTISRTSNFPNIRYLLKPYFGGNNYAPHTMNIEITKL